MDPHEYNVTKEDLAALRGKLIRDVTSEFIKKYQDEIVKEAQRRFRKIVNEKIPGAVD